MLDKNDAGESFLSVVPQWAQKTKKETPRRASRFVYSSVGVSGFLAVAVFSRIAITDLITGTNSS